MGHHPCVATGVEKRVITKVSTLIWRETRACLKILDSHCRVVLTTLTHRINKLSATTAWISAKAKKTWMLTCTQIWILNTVTNNLILYPNRNMILIDSEIYIIPKILYSWKINDISRMIQASKPELIALSLQKN